MKKHERGAGPVRRLEHWHIISGFLIGYDAIAVALAYFLALWLRFDCHWSEIPKEYLESYLIFIPFYIVFCLIVFQRLRLYRSIWRFASYSEFLRTCAASAITCVFHAVFITLLLHRMPATYYVLGAGIQFAMVLGIRFSYRLVLLLRSDLAKQEKEYGHRRVMLIGAGEAGQMILRDIQKNQQAGDHVCCIIDDNRNKWGRYVDGIPVVGGREDILTNVEKYHVDRIVVAIPSLTAEDRREILNVCKETGCELKSLPGLYQLLDNEVRLDTLRDVAVEDLLGRPPIQVNMEEIYDSIREKRVLITGAGGSIGSELARQVARHEPEELILVDAYENGIYDTQLDLLRENPDLKLTVLIGSVRDASRMNQIFGKYQPDIVYHAAAHKHVPLMEDSPSEAIKNNVMGTYNTAWAAVAHGCRRFVLISTDKAVNPTNIMGASKRLCEMVIQSFDRLSRSGRTDRLPAPNALAGQITSTPEEGTEFVAVRFGNVLGSNGSVVPLFKKQIAMGGPVTVTHPDIIRYFMTIPEAVSLVLQAGCYAHGGEIFVFDMGDPVKIDTLARNLIKLSGLKPDVDIPIRYTGLRPGEKLYEEKLMAEEGLDQTPNELIHVGRPLDFDVDQFIMNLSCLKQAADRNEEDMGALLADILPTYHPADRRDGT